MSALKLQFMIECVDGATKKVRDIQASVDKALKPVRDIGQGFVNVKSKIVDLANEGGMQRVSAAWDGFASRVKALPIIAAISMAGVVAAVSRTEQQLESAVRTAMRISMPVAQFQQLSFAAKQAGVGPEELAHGLQHLGRAMVEARQGNKEALQWFHLVGISAKDLKTANPFDVMLKSADVFKRVGDAGQNGMLKTSFLMAMMSRSGPELKNFFDQGGAGIKAMMVEAEKMGAGLNEVEAKGILTFASSVAKLGLSLDVIMARIVTRLNPVLTQLIDTLTGKNVENGRTIVKVVGDALDALIKAMPKVLTAFGGLTKVVVLAFTVLDKLAGAVGGWDNLFVAFAAVAVGKGVWAIGLLVQSMFALSSAMLLTPFGWVVLGVAALVVAGYQLYKHWDGFKQFWVDLWANAKTNFQHFLDWFLAAAKPVMDIAKVLFPGTMEGQQVSGPFGVPIKALPSAFEQSKGMLAGDPTKRQEVGGELRISIDDNRAAQVTGLRKAPGGILDYTLDSGQTLSTR